MEIVQAHLFGIKKEKIAGLCEAVPHVGFDFDMIIAVRHSPIPDRLAIWRRLARDPWVKAHPAWGLFERYLLAYNSSPAQEKAEIQKEIRRYMLTNLATLTGRQMFRIVPPLFDIVKKDYGHMFIAFRQFGKPVAKYGSARAVGFYPTHLCEKLENGVVMHCDGSLSPSTRVAKMLRYDDLFAGGVSNDDTVPVTSCAIFRLSRAQFVCAAPVIRQAAANKLYNSFNRLEGDENRRDIQNCVGFGVAALDMLKVEIPDEFRADMPKEIAAATEKFSVTEPFKGSRSAMQFVSRESMSKFNAQALAEFREKQKQERPQSQLRMMGIDPLVRMARKVTGRRLEAA